MAKTAMQIMYDELMAHEYTIPISLIVTCKELIDVEREQMHKCASFWRGKEGEIEKPIFDIYYKDTYENK